MQTAAYHQNRVLPRDLWFRGTALADVRKGERNHVLGYGRMPLKVGRNCGEHSLFQGDACYRLNAEIRREPRESRRGDPEEEMRSRLISRSSQDSPHDSVSQARDVEVHQESHGVTRETEVGQEL